VPARFSGEFVRWLDSQLQNGRATFIVASVQVTIARANRAAVQRREVPGGRRRPGAIHSEE
jgi:hypothetical protein